MVPFYMLRIVSYYCALVILSVSRIVFSEIRLEKCRNLEYRIKGP